MHYATVAALFVVGVLGGLSIPVLPCAAQTTSPSLNGQQNQATQSPPAGSSPALPSAGVSGPVNAATTQTLAPGVGTATSSSVGKSYGSAGQGLPGMPGGPPIKGPMGAQDPSSQYMRPPVIPPLFCDPAVNIPC